MSAIKRIIIIAGSAWIIGWMLIGCMVLQLEFFSLTNGAHDGLVPLMVVSCILGVITLGAAFVLTGFAVYEWIEDGPI